MASSGSFTTTASQSRSLTFKWEIKSQSVADNKTTISWQVVGAGSASGYVIGGGIYVKINGTVVVDESTDTRYNIYNGTVVKSGTTTIAHNSDGTKTFSAEVKAGIYQYARNVSGSGSWTLTAIPRKATLSTATNFNDEGNPSITYSNPAGSAVSTLQAYIYASDDSTVLVGGKNLSKSGTSFTFSLTAAERNTLRNACTTSNSMTVKFYVKTIISGTTYWSSAINKTFSIINANPTSTVTVKDTNSAAIALTGNAAKMIKGYNTISASMTATALKGATIKSYKITNGSTTKNSSSATFEATETPTFTFLATDSRGNTVSKTVTMPMVEYIKPTCGLSADMTVDGIVNATISGKCYNGSFGAASNKIVVQYRYKISGGNYGNWMDSVATFNNGGYNASVVISGLDYRSKYLIQARITDTISNQTSVEKTLSCIPVFDWSENDFNFNVPVTMNNKTTLNDEVQVNGKFLMEGNYSEGCIYGLGGLPSIPYNADLNDYKTPGAYGITSNSHAETISNLPSGMKAGKLIVYQALGNTSTSGIWVYLTQEYIPLNTDYPSFKRSIQTGSNANSWSYGDWCPIGGDFIMEEGTSGIWTYRKWYSGKAECWGRQDAKGLAVTAAWGGIYVKDGAFPTVKFPFTFVEIPALQTSPIRIGNSNFWLFTNSATSTTYTGAFGVARGATSSSIDCGIAYYAVGRWK